MDAFAADLERIGWLHNHARLWLASYVVHWRRVRWQAGARWFLRHLLDGDPASNNLSWQWVASSFGSKPYIFNRENLERFSGGRYCRNCPRANRGGARRPGGCPFEASYEELQQRLFRPTGPEHGGPDHGGPGLPSLPVGSPGRAEGPTAAGAQECWPSPAHPPQRPILWIHGEALGPANPALREHPDRPALFVFDQALIDGGTTTSGGEERDPNPLSLKRLGFLYECLLELPVTIRRGDVAAELIAFARRHRADGIVTSQAVDPHFERILSRLAAALPVQVLTPEPFVSLPEDPRRPPDLKRFSRYWRRAEPLIWGLRQAPADIPGGGAAP
jgi:deoxyribodipyrimidine photo-lyase